jgi:hypothetical protein
MTEKSFKKAEAMEMIKIKKEGKEVFYPVIELKKRAKKTRYNSAGKSIVSFKRGGFFKATC